MTGSQADQPSKRRQAPDVGLLVAGLLTSGMALYHFWLPSLWGWGAALQNVPMLNWALFMLNASFSYLLLAGGALTVAIALTSGSRDRAGAWVLIAMCGYWSFNAVYQIVAPMPMPPRMASLKWGLFAFAVMVAWLYVGALLRGRRGTGEVPSSLPAVLPGIGQ